MLAIKKNTKKKKKKISYFFFKTILLDIKLNAKLIILIKIIRVYVTHPSLNFNFGVW